MFSRGGAALAASNNLHREGKVVLVVPERAEPLEEFAVAELAEHVAKVTGHVPQRVCGSSVAAGNSIVVGQVRSNPALARLAQQSFFRPQDGEQGYSIRADRNPHDDRGKSWLATLAGADPHGVLYAVRDFCHYCFCRDGSAVVLRPASVERTPRLKLRGLSESGCNFFSAKNDREGFMHTPKLNYFSEEVVFDKQYYVDWLSEWKVNSTAQ
jgi:hypothetical protein